MTLSKRAALGRIAAFIASILLVHLGTASSGSAQPSQGSASGEGSRSVIDQSHLSPEATYAASQAHPFGRVHPGAPPEVQEFAFLIGEHECRERLRLESGSWLEFRALWRGRYVLGGFAIQDEYYTAQVFATNLRIFDPLQKKWIVTFSRMPGFAQSHWRGEREGEKIVMRRVDSDFEGPTFSQISRTGFEWNSGGRDPNWYSSCRRKNVVER